MKSLHFCINIARTTTALIPALLFSMPATAQLSTGEFSCPASECRINQSSGTSSSVGVGVTSSFGVTTSAQSTSNYNASTSASLVLNSFDQTTANQLGYNTSIQAIGSQASDAPIAIEITSETVQTRSKESNESQYFNATNYKGDETTASTATFNAEGFGAMQDLRFKGDVKDSTDGTLNELVPGSTSGTVLKSDVTKLVDKVGGPEFGTGNASANAETRTRFQADITTSNFVNAFLSAF